MTTASDVLRLLPRHTNVKGEREASENARDTIDALRLVVEYAQALEARIYALENP